MTTESSTVFNTVKEAFAPVTEAFKNFQNVEVPEVAREWVKKTANSAKERAADAYAGSEKVTAAIETAAADSVSEAAKISRNIQQAIYQDAEALLRDHVQDVDGKKHDIVVLGHNIAQVRAQLEAYGVPGAVQH